MSEEEGIDQGHPLTNDLGTPDKIRLKGDADRMMFTNLTGDEIDWLVFCELGTELGIKPLKVAENVYLRARYGVGGLGLRYLVRGEAVRKGIGANPDAEMPERPGWLARHNPLNGEAKEQEQRYQNWKKETQLE